MHSCLYQKVKSSPSRSRGSRRVMSVRDDVIDIFTFANNQRLNRHKNKLAVKHCDVDHG